MAEFYLSNTGSDTGSGSLADPWRTIARAVQDPSWTLVLHLQPGVYAATDVKLLKPISLMGLAPGVCIEPSTAHGPWSVVSLGGQLVWYASATNLPAGRRIQQAMWVRLDGHRERIPVWSSLPPLDTPAKWAAALLGPNNPHTRWGLYPSGTALFLIPPVDGGFIDPNTVKITVAWAPAFAINGPGVSIQHLELAGHTLAVRLEAVAENAHLADLDVFGGGLGQFGGTGPTQYGHDHLIERVSFRDNGTCIREGDAPPIAGQGIPWYLVKSDVDLGISDATGRPLLVHKPLTSAETCAIVDFGGSLNTVIQDCTVDGYFDGFDSWDDGRYDASVDGHLRVRRCTFSNLTDDALDRSRYQADVVFEDCVFRNVGTVLSPAPLWGDVTLRRCTGSRIGEQVRIPDGLGNRPHGSVVKYGASDAGHPQGHVTLEDCIFWSDTPSTQGLCPDGGDGSLVPTFTLIRTTLRVPFIVLNWGAVFAHPDAWLSLTDTTLSSTGPRPLKTQPGLGPSLLTPAAIVDARYFDPAQGDFSLMTEVTDLQAQLLEAQTALQAEQAAHARLIALVRARQAAQAAEDAAVTTNGA